MMPINSRYNHAVVFSETSLYNKTDASGSTNKKVILTGTKGSAGGTNYITANTGFGFSNVFNASLVEVAGGKRFVLTGKEMSPADLGHIHQTRDSSFFSDDAALLPGTCIMVDCQQRIYRNIRRCLFTFSRY